MIRLKDHIDGHAIGPPGKEYEFNMNLLINAKRNGYAPDQCGRTLTVAALIEELKQYNDDTLVYLLHDGGYTYGSITENDFEEGEYGDE